MASISLPKGYVDTTYLQSAAALLKQAKLRSYDAMRIQPDDKVLDVGCGPATDAIALGQVVGATGVVCGVDYDPAMVAQANLQAEKSGVSVWVRHYQADATALPWGANEFNACRSERLFQHLLNPDQALAEMTRVTRPGGWVVVLDTDWGSLSNDTEEKDIERRLSRFYAERCLNNGYSGRQLYRLFKCQDLSGITVNVLPVFILRYSLARQMITLDRTEREACLANIITENELDCWHQSLERADRDNLFYCSACMILVSGRKIEKD